VKRPIILTFFCLLATGCSFISTPHSSYFIVTFASGTPQPSDQGKLALANLTQTAGHPSEVRIAAMASVSDPATLERARQRADLVAQTLVKSGVSSDVVETTIRTVDDQSYAKGKDDLTVQLAYGTKPEE
jgi:hypothetical protein